MYLLYSTRTFLVETTSCLFVLPPTILARRSYFLSTPSIFSPLYHPPFFTCIFPRQNTPPPSILIVSSSWSSNRTSPTTFHRIRPFLFVMHVASVKSIIVIYLELRLILAIETYVPYSTYLRKRLSMCLSWE